MASSGASVGYPQPARGLPDARGESPEAAAGGVPDAVGRLLTGDARVDRGLMQFFAAKAALLKRLL
jgi:hypothetical protein